jgi:hypothetical protein
MLLKLEEMSLQKSEEKQLAFCLFDVHQGLQHNNSDE